MLAALTAIEELRLSHDEAHDLAGALAEVQRHYRLPVLADDKMALVMLAYTAGRIYVPKARAVARRKAGLPVAPAEMPQTPPPAANAAPDPASVASLGGAGEWFGNADTLAHRH